MRTLVVIAALLGLACTARNGEAPRGRIVSLHDVTTETVVSLGAAPMLAGIAEPVDPSAQVRAAVAGVPRVGDLESILAVSPQVVLGLAVVEEKSPELVAELRRRGVDVHLADPRTLGDVATIAQEVGRRVGVPDGGALARDVRRAITAPSMTTGEPPRVFVFDCCDPPFTAGGLTVLSDLIARAGGRNVFSDLDADWTHVSWEEAVSRRPELVVIHAYEFEGQGDVPAKRAALARLPGLAGVPTVVLPLAVSLGGPRSLEGLRSLEAAISSVRRP